MAVVISSSPTLLIPTARKHFISCNCLRCSTNPGLVSGAKSIAGRSLPERQINGNAPFQADGSQFSSLFATKRGLTECKRRLGYRSQKNKPQANLVVL